MTERLQNINVASSELLPTPEQVKQDLPLPTAPRNSCSAAAVRCRRILDRQDPRLFVVVGPCSIHDPEAARDYATRLKGLAERGRGHAARRDARVLREAAHHDRLEGPDQRPGHGRLVPHREGLCTGARAAAGHRRAWACRPATEALDPITPQYLSDLITWTAIGARTTESQTHREMASGLSTPVGFKNGTDGSLHGGDQRAAVGAPARTSFLGINQQGQSRGDPHPRQPLRPHRAARRRRTHRITIR